MRANASAMLRFAAAALILCVTHPLPLNAQPAGKAPVLTAAGAAAANGAVSAANAQEHKDEIVPELYQLVRSAGFEMNTAPRLGYDLAYDSGWRQDGLKDAELQKDGSLRFLGLPGRGFVFPGGDELDPRKKDTAAKILWNIQAVLWSQGILEFDFTLRTLRDDKVSRELKGRFKRLYPRALTQEDKTGQLFREVFELQQPEALKYYAWLTFRFFGADEDLLWVYSPALQKARQLTGSSRTDTIAGTISANDFLLASGKIEAVEAREPRLVTGLAPFAGKTLGKARRSGGCLVIEDTAAPADANEALSRWNVGARKFAQGASWLPTEAVFVPRELWRLELNSADPYALYGRQVLYVDAETLLPVYKFVFDRAGKPWKTGFLVWGLAETPEKQRVPYPDAMVFLDGKDKQNVLFDYENVQYCETLKEPAKTLFDPRKLGPAEKPAEKTPDKNAPKKPAPAAAPPPPAGADDPASDRE